MDFPLPFLALGSLLSKLPLAALPIGVLLWLILPYLLDTHGLRKYPGPLLARFTNLWIFRANASPDSVYVIDQAHKKYGPVVRIAPNHLSFVSPEALQAIYGHASGAQKAPFYDAFAAVGKRGIFNTRSRTEHARKRRVLSHMFSPQSVRTFEDAIRKHMDNFVSQWDIMCSKIGGKEASGALGKSVWRVDGGRVWFDAEMWTKLFTFDIIGELAFGQQFNMITRAQDSALVAKAARQSLNNMSRPDDASSGKANAELELEEISAISMLTQRTQTVAPLAVLPPYLRAIIRRLPPYYTTDTTSVRQLLGMAVNAVSSRLGAQRKAAEAGDDKPFDDMFGRLLNGKDENGNPMEPEELVAESITLLIAGSDTTANSVCGMIYYLARDPERQRKLQAEVDNVSNPDTRTFSYDDVKNLPYLDAVINEGLRVFSTVGTGLPRLVPSGGLTILGQHIPEGTEVSVPIYSLHFDEGVWGPGARDFVPERWMSSNKAELLKAFTPFSIGPRACIGRNVALMEMAVFVATLFHRYDITVREGQEFKVIGGFLRKPLSCTIGVKPRFE